MIRTITVAPLGDSSGATTISLKYFEASSSEQNGFMIEDISGLGPAKGTINSVDIASGDGSTFNTSRIGSRNIVLSLILTEVFNYSYSPPRITSTIERVRNSAYRIFPVKDYIEFEILTDNRGRLKAKGYVESVEPEIFSDTESLQVSIICQDPFFYRCFPTELLDSADRLMSLYSSDFITNFEYYCRPYGLISNTINGRSNELVTATYSSAGDVKVPTFIIVEIKTNNISAIELTESMNGECVSIDASKANTIYNNKFGNSGYTSYFKPGDAIFLSSFQGRHYAKLQRGSNNVSILAAIPRASKWIHTYYLSKYSQYGLRTVGGSDTSSCKAVIYSMLAYKGV